MLRTGETSMLNNRTRTTRIILGALSAVLASVTILPASAVTNKDPLPSGSPHTYLLIGDSLTVGVKPYMPDAATKQGWTTIKIVDKSNQDTKWALSQLEAISKLPTVVVMATGTNDPADANHLQSQMFEALTYIKAHGGSRLIWVNVHRDGYDHFNAELARVAKTRKEITIVDWDTWAKAHSNLLGGDGVHPKGPTGYKGRATLIADGLAALSA
jgi:lysophospholipase L1-like esterase